MAPEAPEAIDAVTAPTDADPVNTYDIIERDTVPAPAPRPDDSLQKRIAELVKWLQPTDYLSPGNEYMKHLHSYVPGTGRWVHEAGPFRAWAGRGKTRPHPASEAAGAGDAAAPPPASHRCLHVRGVAGSGKSVFAASTVRELQDAGRVVLFFFFRQIVDKNHTARYLVRDFAAQLLPHCPALVTALTVLSQKHGVSGNELGLVWSALVEALKDESVRGRVCCVVDALDEMDDGDFEGMVEKLVALGTAEADTARVMMTSRPLPHIERALAHPGVVRLKLDPVLLSPDVARYVDARMATLDPPLSDDKNELVRQTICERANGLFLQARLMADNLAEGLRDGRITEETLPDSLDRLPRTLRAVYEDMLKEHARRSGVTAEQQAKILMCVTHASRPLRLIELGSLLSRMLHVDLRRGKELVRAGCGRLLELLEDETVSVIHHSFTEFLHDENRKDNKDRDAFPVLEDNASHAMLAVLLLEYLDGCPHLDAAIDDGREHNYEEFDFYDKERERRNKIRTDTRVNHPLASYAVDNLLFHMSKVPPGPSADQLLAALSRYLFSGKPAFETVVLMNWSGPLSASFNVFHLFATARDGASTPGYVLDHFAEMEPALVDSPDLDGMTPLAYAAENAHDDLVEKLLALGADPTTGGKDGLTPLHRAAGKGHAAAVRILLNAGVDPLIKTWPVLRSWDCVEHWFEDFTEEQAEENRETALAHAFASDDQEVVSAFMPFVPPDEINKCLHRVRAVENVKAILDTGKADVDCFRSGSTVLYDAVRARNLDVVKLLLEHGADPTKRCDADRFQSSDGEITMEMPQPHRERGPTPLHGFAGISYERRVVSDKDKETAAECLRVLIEAGADVNATMDKNGYGQNMTPLHLAVQKTESFVYWGSMDQSEEILTELLLSAGANPNAKTRNGNTPLHLANPEKVRPLELLVQNGADINAVNAWGRTPILEIICRLRMGSSLNAAKPSVNVFEKLLELGADVNVADNEGETVFHHIMQNIGSFANSVFIPVIKKLICAGPDLNKKNNKGEAPLWKYNKGAYGYALNNTNDDDVLKLLVDAGMDLNGRDESGHTILWHLGQRYDIEFETAAKFIRLGADPLAVALDGKTLLHYAAEHSVKPEWFRSLISLGMKADAVDKDGDTVIHTLLGQQADSITNEEEILQILIEAGAQPLAKNAMGQSALHIAADGLKLDMVLSMLAFRGLDINEPDTSGLTPLHHAVELGEEAAGKLVRAGADPTLLTPRSLSPLHIAARAGEVGTVALLLAQYRELSVLEKYVNLLGEGRAPLQYACRSGIPEAVVILLSSGADPRIRDEKGLTPLHALTEYEAPSGWYAPSPRADEVVWILQRAGVDLNAEVAVQTEDETSPRTLTALDLAVERKLWAVVRQLLAHGVEPRDSHKQSEDFILATDKEKAAEEARKAQARVPPVKDSSNSRWGRGRGPRWRGRWAACPVVKEPLEENTVFITSGQDILDLKAKKNHKGDSDDQNDDDEVNGTEILDAVLLDGDYDTIKEYAQLGGNLLELTGSNDHTFLHCLVEKGRVELLEYFGDKVAELEAQEWVQQDEESCGTLLGTACERDLPSLHLIELLVDKPGVDVNAVYNRRGYCYKLRGATALHVLASGAKFWQVEALEYLLSKRPDIEARNKDGMTPLLAAVDTQYPDGFWREETVRVLLRHGADVNATVKREGTVGRGSSALELSSQAGVTKLLLENGASVKGCPDLLARAVEKWMDPAIVKLLLEAGVDPNKLPEQRYALHEAARPTTTSHPTFDLKARQQAIVDLLLSHGADAYAPYPDGSFVFQAIVEDRGLVGSLLAGLSKTNCNRKGHHGRTLLTSACIPVVPVALTSYGLDQSGPATIMADVVHALLESGADPLIADDEGRTPLHWFCTFTEEFDETCHKAFVALVRQGPAAIHTVDKHGRKPIHLALEAYGSRTQHSLSAIKHLLSVGADPADPDPVTGNSALHFIAPRLGGEATAAAAAAVLFRELAACVDINGRNAAGETPVFSFAKAGWPVTHDPARKVSQAPDALAHDITHAKGLDIFTGLGADLMVVDARKQTLLHVTARRELPDHSAGTREREDVEGAFKRLMELGVDPRAEDDELRTAIDVAVARQLSEIVLLFSEEGKRMEEKKKQAQQEKADDQSGSGSESDGFDLL